MIDNGYLRTSRICSIGSATSRGPSRPAATKRLERLWPSPTCRKWGALRCTTSRRTRRYPLRSWPLSCTIRASKAMSLARHLPPRRHSPCLLTARMANNKTLTHRWNQQLPISGGRLPRSTIPTPGVRHHASCSIDVSSQPPLRRRSPQECSEGAASKDLPFREISPWYPSPLNKSRRRKSKPKRF